MDPGTAAALFAGISAVSSVAGGLGQMNALQEQAKIQQYNARLSKIRSSQIGAERRKQVNTALATTQAIAGASGIDLSSSTLLNIRRQTKKDADRALDAELLGEDARRVSALTDASNKRRGGTFAAITGTLDAVSSLSSVYGPQD